MFGLEVRPLVESPAYRIGMQSQPSVSCVFRGPNAIDFRLWISPNKCPNPGLAQASELRRRAAHMRNSCLHLECVETSLLPAVSFPGCCAIGCGPIVLSCSCPLAICFCQLCETLQVMLNHSGHFPPVPLTVCPE